MVRYKNLSVKKCTVLDDDPKEDLYFELSDENRPQREKVLYPDLWKTEKVHRGSPGPYR